MSFAIDKVTTLDQALDTVTDNFLGQFNLQGPQSPDGKTRMTFRKLKTPDGDSLPDVELYIDPQSIQVAKKVFERRQLTKGGFVIQFWGHDLTQLQVNTITGNFQPVYGLQVPPMNEKTTWTSWFNQMRSRLLKNGGPLKIFERIKEWVYQRRFSQDKPYLGMPQIELLWEDFIYDGYFTNFNYNINSNEPFNIAFNFTFMIVRRREASVLDAFGTISPAKLLGDPLASLNKVVKSTTAAGISYAKKQINKQADKIPHLGNAVRQNLIDDLPSKLTLW